MAEIDVITVTFTGGQSLSPQVDIGNKSLVGIQIPANWTTALLSLQASIDGGATWGVVLTAAGGTATPYQVASITGGAQCYIGIDPNILRGISSFKIQSGVPGALTPQTNAAVLSLVTRLAL